jgi:hypothetical protein
VAGAEAGLAGRLAIGRVDRIQLGVLDHHAPPIRVGGAAGPAARRDRLDVSQGLVVEAGVYREPQARPLRIAEGEQAVPRILRDHRRVQDLAQDRVHVEETGHARAGLVEPAEILDLELELAQALAGSRVRRAGPGRDDPGVAGADLDDRVREVASLELAQGIGAKEPERVRAPELVPEVLEVDGGGSVSAREEQADHLAEDAHPAAAPRGPRHLAADQLREALGVHHPVDHDPREDLRRIEGNVGSRGPRRIEIDPQRAQASLELVPVRCRPDDDAGFAGGEAVTDEAHEGVEERRLGFVELDEVLQLLRSRHGHGGEERGNRHARGEPRVTLA